MVCPVVDVEQGWSVLTVLFPVAEHNVRRGAEPPDAIISMSLISFSGPKSSTGSLDHQLVSIAACRFSLSRSDSSQLAPSPPCFLGPTLCSAPALGALLRLLNLLKGPWADPQAASMSKVPRIGSKRSDDRHRYFTAVAVGPSPC